MIPKPSIIVFIAVISVSAAAVIIVSIEAPALLISLYRMVFTTLLIIPFIVFKRRYQQEILSLSKKSLFLLFSIGFILAVHFALWVTSLKLTSVASSVILVTAHPIFVAPLSYFLFKEKLSKLNLIGISISFFGVIVLVYGNHGLSGINSLEGNLMAFLGGIAAGLYIVGGRHFRKQISVIPYVFVVYGVSTIFLFTFCLLSAVSITQISIGDLTLILLMALISGIFGHTLYNWSLAHIKTTLASVALLGEPIGSTILAFILPWIRQIPSNYTLIGGGIILIGIYLTSRNYEKKPLITL
ncbi:MAG: DMT family transporter [Candidatus Thermoplasmatota archaeon]|nr:DMT family transporter [Candidatus Thermoplasmatota archaeon]